MKFALLLLLPAQILAQSGPANPKEHEYSDPKKGREGSTLADIQVNEARLYHFYQRQADFFMAKSSGDVPAVIPAYPGLDAGQHGHWGKHNQNNHNDGRWNDIEMGEHQTQVFRAKDLVVLKGIALRLGDKRELSAVFDPLTLSYRAVWEKGFIEFHPFRWGSSRNATLKGDPWFIQSKASMPKGGKYLGFHRYGKRIIFNYQIGEVTISDEPWASSGTFYRRFDLSPTGHLDLPLGNDLNNRVVSSKNVEAAIANGVLSLKSATEGASVIIAQNKEGASASSDASVVEHFSAERTPSRRWQQAPTMKGEQGKAIAGSSYRVDTIPVPLSNPYNSVMQLTGIAFDKKGNAFVSTLAGEVWRVTGLDQDLGEVTWQRFATGLNQPMGVHLDKDGIFVLDRGQIYRLHDTNNDGEADHYENYANDFGGYDRSHSHTFGLHRTADGTFHFTQRESILKTSPDRKTTEVASGVRNCMGIGGSSTFHWVAPQEGTWTPASSIIEVNQGEFYGLPSQGRSGNIASPLCFIPRGIDNSVGGMIEITSEKWGPFKGNHIGLSYGSGLHYLILRDDSAARPQGATVPLEGEFLAG
ncbi:MAG: DUF6797 domain-containing protein, partial [Akkermansiaceae bacterium]